MEGERGRERVGDGRKWVGIGRETRKRRGREAWRDRQRDRERVREGDRRGQSLGKGRLGGRGRGAVWEFSTRIYW